MDNSLATIDDMRFDTHKGDDTSTPSLPHPDEMARLERWSKSINIALEGTDGKNDISDEKLGEIGQKVWQKYDIDRQSCSEWKENVTLAMDLAMQKTVPKQYPWPKAANIIFPLMTNAALQFAARAYPAIVQNRNVVKGTVIGRDDGVPLMQNGQPVPNPVMPNQPMWQTAPGEKQKRATRIGEHMSWQLLDEQEEWEPETDRLLHALPIHGCMFRKSYFDSALKRNMSLVVSALNLVVNYKAKSLELAAAVTEEIEYTYNEVVEKERSGVFRHITYTATPDANIDEDAPIKFLEQHGWFDLDEDGYKEPYIVTTHVGSNQVVRVVTRYDMDGVIWNAHKKIVTKINPIKYYTQYDFLPNPEGGIYGVGFGQILRPLNESVNTTINMMIDSGHLQVVGGGFIGRGISMNAGNVRFMPGEYKQLNATGASIKDAIVPLQFPGPSLVLFQLLGLLIEAGKEVASIKDVLSGDQPANTPATTTLALIEQGLRAFTAIYKRIHRSLKGELQLLYRLNRKYLDEDVQYKVGEEWKSISRADYQKGSGVEPISDPSMVSDMQKLGRAQYLLTFANDPLINKREIFVRAFKSANIEDVDGLFAQQPTPDPKVLIEATKLQLKEKHDQALIMRENASALLMRAQAVLALTAADKNLVGMDVDWANHQLEVIKTGLDALANGQLIDLPGPGQTASPLGGPAQAPGGTPGGGPGGLPMPGPGGPPTSIAGAGVAPAPPSLMPPEPASNG